MGLTQHKPDTPLKRDRGILRSSPAEVEGGRLSGKERATDHGLPSSELCNSSGLSPPARQSPEQEPAQKWYVPGETWSVRS